jgi:membrane protein DedA with SNARE-associated domain
MCGPVAHSRRHACCRGAPARGKGRPGDAGEEGRKKPRREIYQIFEKHGLAAVLVGSMLPPPFPFTSVLITAGVMQYPKSKFLPALTTGRALRFFGVAGLSRIFGRQIIDFFSAHYGSMLHILVILAVAAGVAALIYFGWHRRKSTREKQAQQSQASSAR